MGKVEISEPTFPNVVHVGALLEALLQERLAARTNMSPKVRSHVIARDGGEENTVHIDEPRIRLVVIELLDNALHNTVEGSVTLEWSWHSLAQERGELLVSVIDTGCGINSEDVTAVFEPFCRGEVGFRRGSGARLGLGLAICHAAITGVGGGIGVESSGGKGCQFWIRFPCRRAPSDQSAVNLVRRASSPLTTSKKHVLLAEDDETNQLVIAALIARLGHTCRVVSNGREASQLALNERFDVILMDIHMPVMDGIEATTQIRRFLGPLAPPVIAVTAATIALDHPGTDGLFAGLLEKPVNRKDLEVAISHHTGHDERV